MVIMLNVLSSKLFSKKNKIDENNWMD